MKVAENDAIAFMQVLSRCIAGNPVSELVDRGCHFVTEDLWVWSSEGRKVELTTPLVQIRPANVRN
jgi:hypothetical protein